MKLTCAALLLVVACGGDEEHEPLISGMMTGEFEGTAFTIAEGVADETEDAVKVFAFGTDAINCGSAEQTSPPHGYFAAVSMPSFDVGSYSSVLVIVYENRGSFSGHGSTVGSVEITASSAESVAGTVSFDYTDQDTSLAYRLDGSFEVVNCSP